MTYPDNLYDCIVLAAGESSRMGEWKLLLPCRGVTVIECSVQNALAACSRVLLVVGHRAEDLRSLFADWGSVEIVENGAYSAGMFSSIRAGVEKVRTERFFVALGDMPVISPTIFRMLVHKHASSEKEAFDAVRPSFNGQKGHPVLLAGGLIDTIRNSGDSGSMRDVLRGRRTLEVAVADRSVIYDIDTPADYADLSDIT